MRWLWLLLASCYFYMAFVPIYILILGFTIIVDYAAGLLIERSHGTARKAWLGASLVANIGVLAVFKYYNWLNESLSLALQSIGIGQTPLPYLAILLPIGLSFHTFQAMSYTIEVYRGHQKVERHLGIYSLYVMFYPQLVAGPIERPQNVLHQFHERHRLRYTDVANGLKLMAWGLFKKVVIADRLAVFVDQIYDHPHQYTGVPLWIASIFFTFQMYCDFSGYSDIALGSARTMGFNLMTNFRRPYQARTIPEFWSRWHISLSTWFRDYLYIPMGGNRISIPRWYFNLAVVFMVSGLWHGAAWTFIVWGALNGLYQIVSVSTAAPRRTIVQRLGLERLPVLNALLDHTIVFLLITVARVFFRSTSLANGWHVISHLFVGIPGQISQILHDPVARQAWLYLGQTRQEWLLTLSLVALLMTLESMQERIGSLRLWLSAQPKLVRWPAYYALIVAIVWLGVAAKTQFIYFQF